MKPVSTALLLAAAGRGIRTGGVEAKAWINILNKPLLWHSLQCVCRVEALDMIVALVPPGDFDRATKAIRRWRTPIDVKVAEGGPRRLDTIMIGLESLPPECEIVVVHDAARPFASPALFSRVIEAAQRTGAATAAVEPVDTVVKVDKNSEPIYLERNSLRLIQTPQAFRAETLIEAHKKAAQDNIESTDDASLIKRMGAKVELVEGESVNFKITYPEDIKHAEVIIEGASNRIDEK